MENVENFTDVFGTSDEKLIFSAEEDFNVFKMFAPLLFVHFHLWWKLKVLVVLWNVVYFILALEGFKVNSCLGFWDHGTLSCLCF